MQHITLADPAWSTTFPHLETPREGEGLTGLLLRCDEANHWGTGLTLSYLLDSTSKKKRAAGVGQLTEKHLEKLASALALPLSSIVATTYRIELFRLYGEERSRDQLSSIPVPFHLCPICMSESQLLARTLDLPGIAFCPKHQVPLVERCQCGSPLVPFHPHALPFACYACGLEWARLFPARADLEGVIASGQKWLAYYTFFFTQGTPNILASAFHLVSDRLSEMRDSRIEKEDQSLAMLIRGLVTFDVTTDDILRQMKADESDK